MIANNVSGCRHNLPLIPFLMLTLLSAIGGCSQRTTEVPETFPVSGSVVDAKQQPLSGGVIYFHSGETGALEAVSEIGKDGSFSLYTMFDGQRLEGAVAGEHRVSVVPPSTSGNMPGAIVLSEIREVHPQPNEITIELPH